jgi:hypothetical protein
MYAAQAYFDGLYTADDLPDSLTINPYDLNSGQSGISVEVSRNGLIYGPYQFFEGYSQQVTIVSDFAGLGPKWVLQHVETNNVLDDNNCLFEESIFGEGFGAGAGGITDLFEDTYKVEAFDSNGGLFITDIYVRESLCLWVGSEEESSLVFSSPISESFPFGWLAEIVEFDGKKSGNQNTPVGEYPVTSGIFAGGRLEVSIP